MKEQLATPGIKALETHKERMKMIGEFWAVEKEVYKEQYKKRLAAGVTAALKTKN